MTNGTDYLDSNRALWNLWTRRHLDSDHHADVAAFRAGGTTLRSIEREALGDVSGRSLLHLQCNMGSDTLSWARLGAVVTGVDSADTAIEQARVLASEANLPARFIQSDLYALPDVLDETNETFDIVFSSYGALCWLPDLTRWAAVATRYLRPGGTLLLVEMHPCAMMLAMEDSAGDKANDKASANDPVFRVRGSYFHTAEPQVETAPAMPALPADSAGSGDDGAADAAAPQSVYIWHYSLGEVVTALISAGLRIESLQEYPLAHYQQFPALVRGDDGWWRWPSPEITLPMLFAVRATKPE